jgi:hypothetical protein
MIRSKGCLFIIISCNKSGCRYARTGMANMIFRGERSAWMTPTSIVLARRSSQPFRRYGAVASVNQFIHIGDATESHVNVFIACWID